jgi:hypothetical protein
MAGLLPILSILRLCGFAEQITRPRPSPCLSPPQEAAGVWEAKRMPSLRSKRETRERREMQAVGQVLTLSRLTSFPVCLAAGPCLRVDATTPWRGLAEQTFRDCPALRHTAPCATRLMGFSTAQGLANRGKAVLHEEHVAVVFLHQVDPRPARTERSTLICEV